MYLLRKRWASVFTRDIFSAGLLATSRSESANKVMKEICRSSTSLFDLVIKYDGILQKWRRGEREEDMHCRWLPGQYVRNNPLLTHAASVYTRALYKAFEEEVKASFNVILEEFPGEVGEWLWFNATSTGLRSRPRVIQFNRYSSHATCSCRMWESEGIPCRHIVKVFYLKNVVQIPDDLILKRWTKGAKFGESFPLNDCLHGGTMNYMLFVNKCMRDVYEMATSSKDSEVACSAILEQLANLRLEVSKIVGSPMKPCDGSEPTSGKVSNKIQNPKKIRGRVYVKKKRWQAEGRKKRGVKGRTSTEPKRTQLGTKTTINFMNIDEDDSADSAEEQMVNAGL
ncbi:protein FAR1-RELATED SEQUENCE 5-like [Salvia miltiorrhiza]|uniref:protein FAR1-RELATED SEQUENCE 5-like n=1 Tax=Salvia miltiorrhiza TaxID=226208 RepID=UPI0025ABA40D|nr:protein FAR1-RELATED SEQUENCE 5-like [Salvia miltiorrhiza]